MSGRDERTVFHMPQCAVCGSTSGIVILYAHRRMAGWILDKRDEHRIGFPVITASTYAPDLIPITVECTSCGNTLSHIANEVIAFFREKTQNGEYMSWNEFGRIRYVR